MSAIVCLAPAFASDGVAYLALWAGIGGHIRLGWAGVVVSFGGHIASLVLGIIARQWGVVAICAVAVAVIGWLVWSWLKPRRKYIAKLAGAKSRALVAALVRRAREAAKPRPVLRPQPGGPR